MLMMLMMFDDNVDDADDVVDDVVKTICKDLDHPIQRQSYTLLSMTINV